MTGKVYSCTLFEIGFPLEVYFLNALYPVPYGCLPVWDIWWSQGNFVSCVIGMHCQTGAVCMHLFVLFVFAVNSCLIQFLSQFLAMLTFFLLKTHWKYCYWQCLWKGASWNGKLHFWNSTIYKFIFLHCRPPRHLEVKYVIQIFCNEIVDTSKMRMFYFTFCSIVIYGRVKSESFWSTDKLKIKYSWYCHN